MKKILGLFFNFILMRLRVIDLLNHGYDLILFYRYSYVREKIKNTESLRASILKEYHAVEKGLALPIPRKGFGRGRIPMLIEELQNYEARMGSDSITKAAKDALREYIRFNRSNNENLNDPYYQSIIQFIDSQVSVTTGGVKLIKRKDIQKAVDIDYFTFVKTRMSTRDFSHEVVSIEDISKAVQIAKNTPSVCNRQSWKVHFYSDKTQINKLLSFQNGNTGFGHTLQNLIIVSTDIRAFTKMEGNQLFTDGGLFSMNLLYALHSLSIGSCCLNTCVPFWKERKIKTHGKIASNERIIMMIAIGKLKDEYKTAFSEKKDINLILNIH